MNRVHVVRERNTKSVMELTPKTNEVLMKLKMLTVSVSIFLFLAPVTAFLKPPFPNKVRN